MTNTADATDTGHLAAVPEEQMRDFDDHAGDNALEGGADDGDLESIFANPGELVDLGAGES